jgi:hypothetical protein
MSSRIMVKRITQVSLTAGFEMRPGVSPPLWPSNHQYCNSFFLLYTTCLTIEPANERLVAIGLNMSPKLHAYTLALSNESSIRAL